MSYTGVKIYDQLQNIFFFFCFAEIDIFALPKEF